MKCTERKMARIEPESIDEGISSFGFRSWLKIIEIITPIWGDEAIEVIVKRLAWSVVT
jgi:hypothetical protein